MSRLTVSSFFCRFLSLSRWLIIIYGLNHEDAALSFGSFIAVYPHALSFCAADNGLCFG